MFRLSEATGSFSIDACTAMIFQQQSGLPWWAWVLIIIVVILLLYFLWQWWKKSQKKEETPATTTYQAAPPPAEPPAPPPAPVEVAAPVEPAAPPKPDDLTIIEGIGPKIASILVAAGITTFQQLADTEASQVSTILHNADLRLADPTTWGEQARLAAENKWEDLKVLQDSLKGGRHV